MLADDILRKLLFKIHSDVGPDQHTAVEQDLMKGRRSEIDYINGITVRNGRKVNIPTPLNEAVISLIYQIEQGKLEISLSTLDMMEQYM